jgi:hypothetical protein
VTKWSAFGSIGPNRLVTQVTLSGASEVMTIDQLTPENKGVRPFASYFANHGWGLA